jgi:hypothetical protein
MERQPIGYSRKLVKRFTQYLVEWKHAYDLWLILAYQQFTECLMEWKRVFAAHPQDGLLQFTKHLVECKLNFNRGEPEVGGVFGAFPVEWKLIIHQFQFCRIRRVPSGMKTSSLWAGNRFLVGSKST